MRFIVDAQLPPGLAERIRASGLQAEHVYEIGLGAATDDDIWNHVCTVTAALVTKDEDFANRIGPPGTAVVWIRLGNTTNRALWQAIEPVMPEILDALRIGERLIEVR